MGHRVETEPGCGLISDITHAAASCGEGGQIGADAKGRIALQLRLSRLRPRLAPRFRIGGIRLLPMTAAAAFGFLVGFALAMGSRGGTSGGRAWLRQPNSRPNFRDR